MWEEQISTDGVIEYCFQINIPIVQKDTQNNMCSYSTYTLDCEIDYDRLWDIMGMTKYLYLSRKHDYS